MSDGKYALLLSVALMQAACAPRDGAPADDGRPKPATAAATKDRALGPGLEAERVAKVPAGTFGPYLARRDDARLLVWAALAGAKRSWKSVVLDAAGKPAAPAQTLGDAPERVGLVTVEAAGKGYALLYSTDAQPTKLEALFLDESGRRISGPELVAQQPGDVLWVDWVDSGDRPLALWALRSESAKADRADIFVWAQGAAKPTRIVTDVRAWQAVPFADGAALAVVRAAATALGPVDLLRLDASGKVTATTPMTTAASAEPDVDMVRVGQSLVLAWTEHGAADGRVMTCAVSSSGKVSAPPQALSAPRGDQSLIRLVQPQSGNAFIVWEDAVDQRPDARRLRVARLGENARTGSERALLEFASVEGGVPELAATAQGLSALTLARPCKRGQACDDAPVATLVELDRTLTPTLATPLTLAPLGGKAAPLAWGLTCGPSRCLVLAATDGAPAEVYAVRPDAAAATWQPAAQREQPSEPPALEALSTLARADAPITTLDATAQGEHPVVAWLTFFDPTTPWQRLGKPAADGRFDPARATVATTRLGSGSSEVISFRARSSVGLSLASDGGAFGEALLVWGALDAKIPQVFTTVVDASGKKLRQRMLTRSKGEKLDAVTARVADGWVVAWIDERGGAPEIYSAKVNRFLQRVGPEHKVGGSAPSSLALHALGKDGVLAWVEGSGQQGRVHLQRLAAQDGAPQGSAATLGNDGATARAPTFATSTKGTVLGFLEAADTGSVARLQLLDDQGAASGPARGWRIDAEAVSLALHCAADECRLVAVTAEGGRGGVHVGRWPLAGTPREAKRIAAQSGAAVTSSRLVLIDADLLLADQSLGRGLIRHARIKWQ
ncbi:MAG: hypothetical protein R3B13_17380 [Polyangiaceae bacterium]